MIHSAAAVVATAAAAYILKLPLALGAHPFWAAQVLVLGAIFGFVLALFPSKNRAAKLVVFSVITAVSACAAAFGKTRFAASYAEDQFAGQLWYFGWFGITIFGFATIAAIAAAFSQR